MYDVLYREQSNWSNATDVPALFNTYAEMLGLNIDRFKKDMDSDKAKARVELDEQRGAALGLANTPTIFINNRQVPPASLNPAGLRAALDSAMNAKPAK